MLTLPLRCRSAGVEVAAADEITEAERGLVLPSLGAPRGVELLLHVRREDPQGVLLHGAVRRPREVHHGHGGRQPEGADLDHPACQPAAGGDR